MALIAGAVSVYLRLIDEPDEDVLDETTAHDRYEVAIKIDEELKKEKELKS